MLLSADLTNYFEPDDHVIEQVTSSATPRYDADAKAILSYRIVLANILKYSIEEFADYDVEQLADMIPKNESDPYQAKLKNSVDNHGDLSTVEFDIYTSALLPTGIEIFLDFEAQNCLFPSVRNGNNGYKRYSLAKRAAYYTARMLSSQLLAGNNDYDSLRRCYSIWLLFDPASYTPQVLSYKFSPMQLSMDNLGGQYDKDVDLMRIVFIALDKTGDSVEPIQEFLGSIFFKHTEVLSKYIPKSLPYSSIYKEVSHMCDLRELYKSIGLEQGLEEGRAEGRASGQLEIFTNYAKANLGVKTALEVNKDLIEILGASPEQADRVIKSLTNK